MLFSKQVLDYHFNLKPTISLPAGVEWLFPYSAPETQRCMTSFYQRFYLDRHPRLFILGINPGRFGAGLTGVPFTDPIRLEKLGISNSFPKKPELSSVFVYELIDACGGPDDFYSRFYITSLSPLGLIKDGVNYNYYDDPRLARIIEPFIIQNINTQIKFGCNSSIAFCLGQGKNFTYLNKLNQTHQWWERILPPTPSQVDHAVPVEVENRVHRVLQEGIVGVLRWGDARCQMPDARCQMPQMPDARFLMLDL